MRCKNFVLEAVSSWLFFNLAIGIYWCRRTGIRAEKRGNHQEMCAVDRTVCDQSKLNEPFRNYLVVQSEADPENIDQKRNRLKWRLMCCNLSISSFRPCLMCNITLHIFNEKSSKFHCFFLLTFCLREIEKQHTPKKTMMKQVKLMEFLAKSYSSLINFVVDDVS